MPACRRRCARRWCGSTAPSSARSSTSSPLRLARAGAAGLHRPVSSQRHRHGRDGAIRSTSTWDSAGSRSPTSPRSTASSCRSWAPCWAARWCSAMGAARLLAPSVFLIAASQSHLLVARLIGRPDPLVLAIGDQRRQPGRAAWAARSSSPSCRASPTPPTRRTQYALFTSIMTLPGKVIGGFSGVIVDWLQTRRATCRPGRAARCGGR